MPVIGLITCGILELEAAHIIAADPDVVSVSVTADAYAQSFIDALEKMGTQVDRVSPGSTPNFPKDGRLRILARVMRVGLHENMTVLREAVLRAAEDIGPSVDAIMLGYGLCGNAMAKLDDIAEAAGVPMVLPTDQGEPVDDCVCMIIGGKENYHQELMKCAGTFFMTPGFSRHWKNILHRVDSKKYSPEMLKRMFKDYRRTLILPTEIASSAEILENTVEFDEEFRLAIEHREGTLEIIRRAWERTKGLV